MFAYIPTVIAIMVKFPLIFIKFNNLKFLTICLSSIMTISVVGISLYMGGLEIFTSLMAICLVVSSAFFSNCYSTVVAMPCYFGF